MAANDATTSSPNDSAPCVTGSPITNGSGMTASSVFKSCSPKGAKHDQNDSTRDFVSAATGAGLAGDHRECHAGRVDVPQRLRTSRRPSLYVPGAGESQ